MADNSAAPLFKWGDRVRIYLSRLRGRIVELRGPLGPGGAQIYRVRVRRKPSPAYTEVREDQLILLPPRPASASKPGRRDTPHRSAGMGYTTSFTGAFLCRREVAPTVAAFLLSIETDSRAIPVFADWLEEGQDPRADRVRGCGSYREVHALFHALALEHAAYLRKFSRTRRMARNPDLVRTMPDPVREAASLPLGAEAAYFVGGSGPGGQSHDPSVLDYNRPPTGQPGLWCKWAPNEDGTAIVWTRAEKFYDYVEWCAYLIEHFLAPWGYVIDGEMTWQGELREDQGVLRVRGNVVEALRR